MRDSKILTWNMWFGKDILCTVGEYDIGKPKLSAQ